MKSESEENWKPVAGFEGYYEVSDRGRVRSLVRTVISKQGVKMPVRARVLTQYAGLPYNQVSLSRKGKAEKHYTHRLVATAFVPNTDPVNQVYVNHKNGIKRDNRVQNLEWVTVQGNYNHASEIGLYQKKITTEQVLTMRRRYKGGENISSIARDYPQVDRGTVSRAIHGTKWKWLVGDGS